MSALAQVVKLNEPRYENLDVAFRPSDQSVVFDMKPAGRPCFSEALLVDLKMAQKKVAQEDIKFIVLCSQINEVFNLGGDLELFVRFIKTNDKQGLFDYMALCLSVLHPPEINNKDVHRIAVVEGSAMGGGFEAALCCDYIIAEQGTFFQFPEVLFNLFPGMGAFSYLVRRTTATHAKRMIASGERYSAGALLDMGVIDLVVEKGDGRAAANDYIKRYKKRANGLDGIHRLCKTVNKLDYSELLEVGKLWVDHAMKLSDSDIKMMERLVRCQHKLGS